MSADEPAIDTEQLPIGLANGCYMRDPDGCLNGRAKGWLAEQALAGREVRRADGR